MVGFIQYIILCFQLYARIGITCEAGVLTTMPSMSAYMYMEGKLMQSQSIICEFKIIQLPGRRK